MLNLITNTTNQKPHVEQQNHFLFRREERKVVNF